MCSSDLSPHPNTPRPPPPHPPGALDAAAKLWAEGGLKRFSNGLTPALARSFPANAVGFALYEASKARMME